MNMEDMMQSVDYYMDIATELMYYCEYDKAIIYYSRIIENNNTYFPAYWGRMLCDVQCNDEGELILKGINIESHPDYIEAIKYTSLEERLQLEYVKNCCIMPIEQANEVLMYCRDYYNSYFDIKRSFDELQVNERLDNETNRLLQEFKEVKIEKEKELYRISKLTDFMNYKYFLVITIIFVSIMGTALLGLIALNESISKSYMICRILHRMCLYFTYGFISILGTFFAAGIIGMIGLGILFLCRKIASLLKNKDDKEDFSVFKELCSIVTIFALTTMIVILGMAMLVAVCLEFVYMDEILLQITPFIGEIFKNSLSIVILVVTTLIMMLYIDNQIIANSNTEVLDRKVLELQNKVAECSYDYIKIFNEKYSTSIYSSFIQFFESF